MTRHNLTPTHPNHGGPRQGPAGPTPIGPLLAAADGDGSRVDLAAAAPAELLAEALKWVQVGRVLAIEKCPYLDLALSSMIPVPVVGLGTTATDTRWRFYYDPLRIMAEPEEPRRQLLMSDWIHEVGHHLRDHSSRWEQMGQPAAMHHIYNVAGDALINADLAELGLRILPTDVTFERLPDGPERSMTTEQIYALLLELLPPQIPGGARTGGAESREPAGGAHGWLVPDCGSGAGGPRRPWELSPGGSDQSTAADRDTEAPDSDGSVDPGRAELIRQETASQIRQHVRSQGNGHVPHRLREWAEAYLEPAVDWRKELRSAVSRTLGRAAGRFDYTWARPARRRIPGYTTPGMAAPEPPTVAVVVDTSGSMSPEDLAQAIADIASLARAAGGAPARGAPVRVIPCDTHVGEVQPVRTKADAQRLRLTGGGGTNMAAGLQRAAELRPLPQAVVTITDGYTPWPAEPPPATQHTPHIAVLVHAAGSPAPDGVPDWMHVIDAEIAADPSEAGWRPGGRGPRTRLGGRRNGGRR